MTPPNRNRPVYYEKPRPQSNKVASAVNLLQKKKNTSNKNYVILYSKLKSSNLNKLNDHIGLLQKPFDYNASFTKVKKPSRNTRKNDLINKRMSVFSNTYAANKKKLNEVDSYQLIDKNHFDLNKTFDMVVQNTPNYKYKSDLTYGNLVGTRILAKNDLLVKQKPAAPEIKKRTMNVLTNIIPSLSEVNMLHYTNVSSVKSFVRPKSMERIKRKPATGNKKKTAKSKPRKKTVKRIKNDFSTFDHSGSMIVNNSSHEFQKSFGRDRSGDNRIKASTSYKNRRLKLDNEVQNLGIKKDKMPKSTLYNNLYQSDQFFSKKLTGKNKKSKDKSIKNLTPTDTQILSMITGLNKDALMLKTVNNMMDDKHAKGNLLL